MTFAFGGDCVVVVIAPVGLVVVDTSEMPVVDVVATDVVVDVVVTSEAHEVLTVIIAVVQIRKRGVFFDNEKDFMPHVQYSAENY